MGKYFEKIGTWLLGRRYWANVINVRGTDKCELCCFIFRTSAEADEHRRTVDGTASFMWVETVSFRSRKEY